MVLAAAVVAFRGRAPKGRPRVLVLLQVQAQAQAQAQQRVQAQARAQSRYWRRAQWLAQRCWQALLPADGSG